MAEHSRNVDELVRLREGLKKALSSVGETGVVEETVSDIINKLKEFEMTLQLIKETRMVDAVNDVVKKYDDKDGVGARAKSLLKSWKKALQPPTAKTPTASVTSSTTSSSTPRSQAATSSSSPKSLGGSSSAAQSKASTGDAASVTTAGSMIRSVSSSTSEGEWGMDEDESALTPLRRTMLEGIANSLKSTTDDSFAKFIGFQIESCVNAAFPEAQDRGKYTSKARLLLSSLKTCESLRVSVTSGAFSPMDLVNMSPKDLADPAVQEERRKMLEDSVRGRQTDLYQEASMRIQKQNGIDSEGGEFVCSRCKGTKTSHYCLQTRSSDEPMTIFVQCLTCKKRWRQ